MRSKILIHSCSTCKIKKGYYQSEGKQFVILISTVLLPITHVKLNLQRDFKVSKHYHKPTKTWMYHVIT